MPIEPSRDRTPPTEPQRKESAPTEPEPVKPASRKMDKQQDWFVHSHKTVDR